MHNNVLYSHHELLRFLNLAWDTSNVGHESRTDRSRTKEMKLPEKGEENVSWRNTYPLYRLHYINIL